MSLEQGWVHDWWTPDACSRQGRMDKGLDKAFWEGTQHRGPRAERRKGWDKEALSSWGWGEGAEWH